MHRQINILYIVFTRAETDQSLFHVGTKKCPQTNTKTNRQTDKQTNSKTNSQTNTQTNRQIDKQRVFKQQWVITIRLIWEHLRRKENVGKNVFNDFVTSTFWEMAKLSIFYFFLLAWAIIFHQNNDVCHTCNQAAKNKIMAQNGSYHQSQNFASVVYFD